MDIKKETMQWRHRHKKLTKWITEYNVMINIVVRIIAISIVSIITTQILPISPLAKANIQEYEIIKKIAQIDDIAHEQDTMLEEVGNAYNTGRDKKFHIIDNKYHTAQYRNEKYKAAIELNELIKEQSEFLYHEK